MNAIVYDFTREIVDSVLEHVEAQGYELRNIVGDVSKGVTIVDPRKEFTFYERRFLRRPKEHKRPMELGSLWFDNLPRGATPQNWIFEVYGRENVDKAEELIRPCQPDGTKITIRLLSETPRHHEDFFDWLAAQGL